MKISSSVWKETGHIAAGVGIGSAVMVLVFFLLGKLNYTVILGALLGCVGAIANFFCMCLSCQRAVNDPDRAALIVRKSYTTRMLAMVAIMILGYAAPVFHVVAVVIPFLLPSITIKMMQLLGMYRPDNKGGDPS